MEQEKQIFINGLTDEKGNVIVDGCIRRGIPEETALDIFSEMESFASYAFNRAHAAAYAYISYQTAYEKYHYPCEFMAALLTSVLGDSGKVASYIDECVRQNISVLPPDINESDVGFTVSEKNIRFGLMAIKSIGRGLIETIIEERQNGKYASFYNFCKRVYGKELNRRAVENLIKCGALDGLGANRRQMLMAVTTVLENISEERKISIEGQMNLFGEEEGFHNEPELPKVGGFTRRELLDMERETAGIYLSGHPMSEYDGVVDSSGTDRLCDILSEDTSIYFDGKKVDIICMISKIKSKTTKNNARMAFVSIEDKYGSVEMLVFPRTLDEYGGMITEGNIVRVSGTVSRREDEAPQIICDRLMPVSKNTTARPQSVNTQKKNTPPGLYLRVANDTCTEYIRAKQIIDIFDGSEPLYIFFTESRRLWKTPASMRVDANEVMLRELKRRIGEENVSLVK